MKVCIVNNAWPLTGVGRYIFEIFSEFKKMRKNTDMVYLENRFPLKTKDKNIKTVKPLLKLPIGMGMATFNNFFYFPKKIPKDYDVYHISNETIARCCKFVKNPIITCHDLMNFFCKNYDLITLNLIRRHAEYFKYAKMIITTTEDVNRDIMKILRIPEEKIKVIHIAPSKIFKKRNKTTARKKLKIPKDEKIVLFVGPDEIRKNLATLIKAVAMLKEKIENIKLTKVGSFNERNFELIKKLKLENNLRFFYRVSDEELALVYNAADVYVYPVYAFEGFPLTALEAMASGVPLVASNTKSIKEVVGNVGILVNPHKPKRFADAIQKTISNKGLQKQMRRKSLVQAKEFSWKICAKETWDVYEQVL